MKVIFWDFFILAEFLERKLDLNDSVGKSSEILRKMKAYNFYGIFKFCQKNNMRKFYLWKIEKK